MKALLAALVLAVSVPARAQKAGDVGVGMGVGAPLGATVKAWLSEQTAFDLGIGVSADVVQHGDLIHHLSKFSPQPSKGRVSPYGAVGYRLEFKSNHTDVGIRFMPGVSYFPHMKKLFEFYVEVGPVLHVHRDNRWTVDGTVGLRYYLGAPGSKES